MKKNFKLLYLITLILVITTTGCSLKSAVSPTINNATKEAPATELQTIKLTGQENKTALELLKATHKVETKTFGDLGEFIESIDSIKPDTKHFWAFYINGESSNTGASQYKTKMSDIIEFKIEEIK